jgi:hypothetical protein
MFGVDHFRKSTHVRNTGHSLSRRETSVQTHPGPCRGADDRRRRPHRHPEPGARRTLRTEPVPVTPTRSRCHRRRWAGRRGTPVPRKPRWSTSPAPTAATRRVRPSSRVKGEQATTVSFPPTGSWTTPGTVSVEVSLAKGSSNTLTFSNPTVRTTDFDTNEVRPLPGPNGAQGTAVEPLQRHQQQHGKPNGPRPNPVSRVRRPTAVSPGSRWLFGPSGSGESSLPRAGLVPR